MEITQQLVKQLFDYDPTNPSQPLVWKVDRYSNKVRGKRAGSLDISTGYCTIYICSRCYRLHRIVFLWHKGYLPGLVDHADRVPLNNLIENLRAATHSQNQANSFKTSQNKSGYKGVSWYPKLSKWVVHCQGKHIGYFLDKEEAAKAYDKKAIELFGPSAHLNFPQ